MIWRKISGCGVILALILWGVATYFDWVNSVRFVSHLSLLAIVLSFLAAWRADVPTKSEDQQEK
jgi:hypothetical protein